MTADMGMQRVHGALLYSSSGGRHAILPHAVDCARSLVAGCIMAWCLQLQAMAFATACQGH